MLRFGDRHIFRLFNCEMFGRAATSVFLTIGKKIGNVLHLRFLLANYKSRGNTILSRIFFTKILEGLNIRIIKVLLKKNLGTKLMDDVSPEIDNCLFLQSLFFFKHTRTAVCLPLYNCIEEIKLKVFYIV